MAELKKSFKASSLLSRSHLLLLLSWLTITVRTSMAATNIVQVGAILDLNSTLGKMVNNSLAMAVIEGYYDIYDDIKNTRINLIVRNVPQNDIVGAANAGGNTYNNMGLLISVNMERCKVIELGGKFSFIQAASDLINKQKVRAILGPQNSEQARYIVTLGNKTQVPVIWFPITGPSLLPPPSPSSFYSDQGLNCFEFQAIAEVINALGWQSIVPIYEETEYGSHLIPCLANVFKEMGIQMANLTAIASNSTDYDLHLTIEKLNDMRTHVFLVHLSMDLGTRFIKHAEEYHDMMGEGYAWILTQELSSLTDPRDDNGKPLKGFMQGALGVRPIDNNKTNFRRWAESDFNDKFNSSLTIYGWWAYHTIQALTMALEKLGKENSGTKLGKEIQAIHFTGKSGLNFSLSKGQLNQSVFEVYNVIGPRERIVGSWSLEKGLVQNYTNMVKKPGEYPLKDPLWPGDTLDKPPKLRIGVPRTNSSPEFVNVDVYNSSKPQIYGFAITVFLKAVDVLPFPLNNYDFVPLPNESRSDPLTYDQLLCGLMKDEDLDAIIGDITIVGNRTNCVDFTLPYLDSSVAMLVRVKTSTSKGILFKPFKWTLWLILGGIFVAATVIIITLESYKTSKITEEFRLNPFLVYKIDVMTCFKSKAAGWLVILTSFLFILVLQVYTANLTSILTQGKLKEPLYKDENETRDGNLPVGYRSGSWVGGLLIDQIGFKSSQLIPLGSREEYNSALLNGTVHAIFDETPYLTLFLSKYRSHFMMTGPFYKTGGFAFAFPRKSSLASHFSTAILKVTQDAEPYHVLMAKSSLPTSVEDLEFEDQSDLNTSSLSVANFGGLYPVLISVVAIFVVLSIPSVIKWLRKKMPFKFDKIC